MSRNGEKEIWCANSVKVTRGSPFIDSISLPEGKYKFYTRAEVSGHNPLSNVKVEITKGNEAPTTFKIDPSKPEASLSFEFNSKTDVNMKFSTSKMIGGISLQANIVSIDSLSNTSLHQLSNSNVNNTEIGVTKVSSTPELSLQEINNLPSENKIIIENNNNNSNNNIVETKDKIDDEKEGSEDEAEDEAEKESWNEEMQTLEEEIIATKESVWADKIDIDSSSSATRDITLTKGYYRLILKKNEFSPRKGFQATVSLQNSTNQNIFHQRFSIFRYKIIPLEVSEAEAPAVLSINLLSIKRRIRSSSIKIKAIILVNNEVPNQLTKEQSKILESSPSKNKLSDRLSSFRKNKSNSASPEISNTDLNDKFAEIDEDVSNISIRDGEEIVELVDRLEISNSEYTHRLKAGFYYLGVRSDSKSGGKLKAVAILNRFDDVPITRFESPDIANGETPWKIYFTVSEPQAPAKLTIKVASQGPFRTKGSLKLARVPNPYGLLQLIKRTKKIRNIVVTVAGVLLILHYLAQFTDWIFSFALPIGISSREVIAVTVVVYTIVNRAELSEFIRENRKTATDNITWLQSFEEAEGLDKLRLMKKKQAEKKKKKALTARHLQEL